MAIDENLQPVLDDRTVEAIAARLDSVRSQIADAARAAGRDPSEITLVGVSKFFPAEYAMAAVRLGLADLGENRVQEMTAKIDRLKAQNLNPNWHLIGTLQKNKVKTVIGRTHLIHSVDSLSLLEAISRRSAADGHETKLLLQVNTSGELSKHGFDPEDLTASAIEAQKLPGIRLCGLMTMAPIFDNPDLTLPIFSKTKTLFDTLSQQLDNPADWQVLSMGMSGDFVQAIQCGSTLVRIGTAIFGRRL